MALSDEDKLYIAKLLEEHKQSSSNNDDKKDKKSNKEKLSEALDQIKSSSVVKSGYKALMYTNPVTALIANNMDLFGGIAKAGVSAGKLGVKAIKGLLNKKKKDTNDDKQLPTLSTSGHLLENKKKLLPKLTVTNSTNYIAAKQALFTNCKNYINLCVNGKASGMFTLPNTQQGQQTNNPLLPQLNKKQNMLGNKEQAGNVIEMTKGLNGIYKSTKETSKILSLMNKKVLLISTGVLLGVGALVGLVNWLKNKFDIKGIVKDKKQKEVKKLNTAVAGSAILNFKPEAQAKRLKQQSQAGISGFSETKKSKGDTFATEFGTKAFKFNSKQQETKILAPWDGRLETSTIGDYGYTFKGKCKNGRLAGNFVIVGVGEPYIAPGETFKKGQLLGTAFGDSFKIVADMNQEQAQEYQNMVNDAASNNYQKQFEELANTDKKTNTKRIKHYDKLNKYQAHEVGRLESIDNILDRPEDVSFGEAVKNELGVTTKKNEVNVANKNETTAINNIKPKKTEEKQVTNQPTTTKVAAISQPSNNGSPIIFGIAGAADIQLAGNERYDLIC